MNKRKSRIAKNRLKNSIENDNQLNIKKNLYRANIGTEYHEPRFDKININISVAQDGEKLMQQARDLEANNGITNAILNRFVNLVVGEAGITVEAAPILANGEQDIALAKRIRLLWREFCTSPLINSDTESFTSLLAYIVRCLVRDGDVYLQVIYVKDPKTNKKSIKLRLFTASELSYDTPFNATYFPEQLGIETDNYGKPKLYRFIINPFAATPNLRFLEVPAEQVLSVANRREPNQLRGISKLAPVIVDLKQLELYTDSELTNARIASQIFGDISYVGIGNDGPLDAGDMPDFQSFGDQIHILNLPEGKKLSIHNPNKTNSNLAEFKSVILRGICAAVGIDYEGVSLEINGSYSSSRMALNNVQQSIKRIGDQVIAGIVRPLYRKFLEFALLNDLKDVSLKEYSNIYNAHYHLEKMPHIDPLKDANANKILLQSLQASPQSIAKSQGKNFEEILSEIEQAHTLAKEKDLEFIFNNLYNFDPRENTSETISEVSSENETKKSTKIQPSPDDEDSEEQNIEVDEENSN